MATISGLISLEEYHAHHASQKGNEYWHGRVVRKSVPTWLHSILQALLAELFNSAGYTAGSELELRIDPEWEPKPDVVASSHVESPYPTKPIDIVAEILSPGDDMHTVHEKCEGYERIGIGRIFVFDPEALKAWEWDRERKNLERISVIHLRDGVVIRLEGVWAEMMKRFNRR